MIRAMPSEAFRRALAPEVARQLAFDLPAFEPASLDARLEALFDSGRAAHPSVVLTADAFAEYLARRLPKGATSAAALEELRTDDLYLACACSRGDRIAIAAFDAAYVARVGSVVPLPAGSNANDVQQAVREKLLIGRDGAAPKIVEYEGRGDLAGWVRVVAVRTSLNLARTQKREVLLDDELLKDRAGAGPHDAELRHLKTLYRKEFEDAFRQALAGLEVRDRNMLRQHYIDRLSMEQIGAFYRVHRVTVVRRLKDARKELADGTRRHLKAKLRVTRGELESIMRLIQSHLDVSLRGYLPEDEHEAG